LVHFQATILCTFGRRRELIRDRRLPRIVLFFLACWVGTQPAALSLDVCRLGQKSHEVGGQKVTFCQRGLVISAQDQPYEIIARPPKWEVCLLNRQSKTYCITDVRAWRGMFGMSMAFLGNRYQNIELVEEKTSENFKGLPLTIFKQKNFPGIPLQGRLAGKGRYNAMSRNARYCLTKQLVMAKEPCAILCVLYHLPVKDMVPLKMTCLDENGNEREELATASFEKTTVPDSFFDLPVGFRRVEKQSGVELDSSKASVIDELMDPLGTTKYHK
jgi:hypothetical protein